MWIEHSEFESNSAGAVGGAILYQTSHVPPNPDPNQLASDLPAMTPLRSNAMFPSTMKRPRRLTRLCCFAVGTKTYIDDFSSKICCLRVMLPQEALYLLWALVDEMTKLCLNVQSLRLVECINITSMSDALVVGTHEQPDDALSHVCCLGMFALCCCSTYFDLEIP